MWIIIKDREQIPENEELMWKIYGKNIIELDENVVKQCNNTYVMTNDREGIPENMEIIWKNIPEQGKNIKTIFFNTQIISHDSA